ncbi:acyl-CoA dehydrogenase family protein [Thermodesulfobacterium commune]|uniref:Cyclohex-1-ene-1-carbonyl-CoA dehydrogenase n=1 Tax=Thermodesulfobacterium commune TaxID=1741 RepID=A0A101FI72_9BACT|nr:acyl-CoA dehydrogenase family protein [Thermodesulfobacterium commune]KUK37501.1 MAG: Butyryl-CoA dehydrogenase [Thermodesulfobacterium commune]HAA84428.1 acyl-CoA dehydrogenase [Thermodesulfobacterium commune]
MIDYGLNDTQKLLVDLIKRIGEEYIKPYALEWDEKEVYDERPIKALAQADFFGIIVPKEYGGLGLGSLEMCLAVEHLSYYCAGVSTTYAASFLGAYPIIFFGNQEQKAHYLPRIAKGESLCAFALTEPQAGSDAFGIKTTAKKEGDYYVLNGVKQWITNGGIADIYVVIALTDPSKGARGASAFIVEKGDPGFTVGKKEKKLGLRTSVTTELFFNDCVIPKSRLLAKEGMGFIVALKTLDYARCGAGAQAVGIAQAAMEVSLKHASSRIQFGQPVYQFQAVSHTFADMAMKIEASRSLLYSVARFIDRGAKDFSGASSMVKCFATDVAMWVTERAIQMMGGLGYMRDYPVQKYFRDAKCLQIYEGTNEIQRNVIARELLKHYK